MSELRPTAQALPNFWVKFLKEGMLFNTFNHQIGRALRPPCRFKSCPSFKNGNPKVRLRLTAKILAMRWKAKFSCQWSVNLIAWAERRNLGVVVWSMKTNSVWVEQGRQQISPFEQGLAKLPLPLPIEKQKLRICNQVYLMIYSRMTYVSHHCSNAVLAAVHFGKTYLVNT